MATAAAPSPRTSSFQGAVDTPLGGDTLELGYGANEAGLLRTLWEGPIAYAIVAASSFLVVVIVGSLLFVKPDDALARIDRGEAAGVLKSLEKRGELSPAERLVQGHAYISLGQTEEALISYEEAGKSNVVDTRALEATLVALDDQVAETAIRVLTSWPGPGVDDALVVRARDPRALLRRNAIRVLDHRGKLTPETEEGAALLDIQGGKTCEERRAGLLTLGRVGRSKSALSAVEELDHGAANACLTADLTRVQRDVMTRVAATPAAPAPR